MSQAQQEPLNNSRISMATLLWAIPAAYLACVPQAKAQDDAINVLRKMAEHITSQTTISIKFDSTIEAVTPQLQKIQFTSTGEVNLNRPNQFRSSRQGGYRDVETIFDGKTLTINNKYEKVYAQVDAPGSVDSFMALLHDKYSVAAPGLDLLSSKVFDVMTADILDAKHIGIAIIDGLECEHLAFRGTDVDWQIWIESGSRPIPRRLVITNKSTTASPQYVLRIKEWSNEIRSGAFGFTPDEGMKKVEITALGHVDDIPPGAVAVGEKK